MTLTSRREGNVIEILTWQARTKAGLTLVQLAALTGISKTTLNTIENGQTSPTMRQLEAIAEALQVRVCDLYESDYSTEAAAGAASVEDFRISGNRQQVSSRPPGDMLKCSRKEGDDMSIRQKIDRLLDKLPEEKLKRIYELLKYIYICT